MIEPELLAAYRATIYRVDLPAWRTIDLVIGRRSRAAERLLACAGASRGAFITAFNPGSELRSLAQNVAAQRALERDVARLRRRFWHGAGIGADSSWAPELSVFVAGLPRAGATRLACKYGQLAFVYVRAGARVELVFCERARVRSCGLLRCAGP